MGRGGQTDQASGQALLFGARHSAARQKPLTDEVYLSCYYPPRLVYPKRAHSESFAQTAFILDGPEQRNAQGRTIRYHLAIGQRWTIQGPHFTLAYRRCTARGQATNQVGYRSSTLDEAINLLNQQIDEAEQQGFLRPAESPVLDKLAFHQAWLAYPGRRRRR